MTNEETFRKSQEMKNSKLMMFEPEDTRQLNKTMATAPQSITTAVVQCDCIKWNQKKIRRGKIVKVSLKKQYMIENVGSRLEFKRRKEVDFKVKAFGS